MKKIFNLAVIFAALTAAFAFASCDDNEDDVIDDFEGGKVTPVSELQVVAGKKYQAYQEDLAAFTFKVTSVAGSYKDKNQIVGIIIENADGKKDVPFTLSDAGDSYLIKDGDVFKTANNATAKTAENAPKVVMVLAMDNSNANYTITSATINDGLKKLGAKETKFAEKK